MSAGARVRALLVLMLGAWGCAASAMSAAVPAICNPFGDPPAIITGSVKPDCLDGRMLDELYTIASENGW